MFWKKLQNQKKSCNIPQYLSRIEVFQRVSLKGLKLEKDCLYSNQNTEPSLCESPRATLPRFMDMHYHGNHQKSDMVESRCNASVSVVELPLFQSHFFFRPMRAQQSIHTARNQLYLLHQDSNSSEPFNLQYHWIHFLHFLLQQGHRQAL